MTAYTLTEDRFEHKSFTERIDMTTPRMPFYTCGMIDRLKARIEEAYGMAYNAESDEVDVLKGILRDIRNELHGEASNLEKIRNANSALRECAEYWRERAEECEETLK